MYRKGIILIILLLGFNTFSKAQEDRYVPNCPLHIIIALDFSASELDFLGKLQKALLSITGRFELHPTNLRIGIITFNRGAEIHQTLTGDSDELEQAIHDLRLDYMVFATDIHESMRMAVKDFQENSLVGVPKYFVLVSDGDPHAQMRGWGFEQDLEIATSMKSGDYDNNIDPIKIISLYSGEEDAFRDEFREYYRLESINHMKTLATSNEYYYNFNALPSLIDFFLFVGSCL